MGALPYFFAIFIKIFLTCTFAYKFFLFIPVIERTVSSSLQTQMV